MSERPRPSWMQPIQYVDDRFEPAGASPPPAQEPDDDASSEQDVEELLRRPERAPRTDYECNDTTPVDYSRGPHDEAFGVDDDEPLAPRSALDDVPDDGGFADEDDFEALDGEPEFSED